MSWEGLLKRRADTPKRLKTEQRALWLKASAFHCGMTIIACFGLPAILAGGAGNQRALTRSFSGYGVRTGEVKRRNCALGSCPAAASRRNLASCCRVRGRTLVGNNCG